MTKTMAANAVADCHRLLDLQAMARSRLPIDVIDFLDGGAGDELTVAANQADLDRVILRPRVLRDVSAISLESTVLGQPVAMPVMLAPAGIHQLFHKDGELAVARAASKAGVAMVVSSTSSIGWAEIAAVAGIRWAQVYCYRDRGITRALLELAALNGYSAVCLSVDTPRVGKRLRNLRNRFTVPSHIRRVNLEAIQPKLAAHIDITQYAVENYDAGLSWKDLEWFSASSRLPLVLKGILDPEDARLAVGAGAAGVIVSNHGGRQLDGVGSTISVLATIMDMVAGGCEVYLDGGIRRGTDVARALALGAQAVLIGRPYLWGLAVAGEAGVSHALGILREELSLTMALLGVTSPASLSREMVRIPAEWS